MHNKRKIAIFYEKLVYTFGGAAFLLWLALELSQLALRIFFTYDGLFTLPFATWREISFMLHAFVIFTPLGLVFWYGKDIALGQKQPHFWLNLCSALLAWLSMLALLWTPALLDIKRKAPSYDPLGWQYHYLIAAPLLTMLLLFALALFLKARR